MFNGKELFNIDCNVQVLHRFTPILMIAKAKVRNQFHDRASASSAPFDLCSLAQSLSISLCTHEAFRVAALLRHASFLCLLANLP